ncbi:hypothetical protein TTHERM_00460480 (macronuclear) [Tetrahymena thermophila SB210]|uniref:Uncharacterized protein n=1 Tax=Tetrahymena thermophila (strain SB210) TaxID=312017 RepID=Q23Q36_TETTS|nr:hypothetical protein TTHERM_00460480 [Tetrahymena thermophila SB210]EAR98499.1 hypothetical protein TTHERM_00460480 [Tetrahymena thermophila SB210]|eukprot:XP_001018744.1 hypothetical protein TTHERM_00460480 [Tetrahymena thermophila SB210]
MLGLEQNCFIKEYRKQVDKEALNQIQDAALSNLMNAFGQMNQTYSVLFKDICLTFGALLSIKEELKDYRQEMFQKQSEKIIQEKIQKEMIQQKDEQLEFLQKQLKIVQLQSDQDRNSKQAIQERDQAISSYKQRLFDLQENEKKLLSEKSQLQTRIELLEEQQNSNKVAILEKQTTLHQGYKLTFLNNELKESLIEQPSNVFQQENGVNKNKIYSLDNNQIQKNNTSLLSKFKQDQSDQEVQNNTQLAQKNQQDIYYSNKINQIKPETFSNQDPSVYLQESYVQSSLNANNILGSKKITDEEIFMMQKREAEIKKKKQEDEHLKNQQYMSSLNYNKIISDKNKNQNLMNNKIIEQSKESSMGSLFNKTAFDQSSINNQSNASVRMELEDSSAGQQLQRYKVSLNDRKMVAENNLNATDDLLKNKMEQEDNEKESSDSQYNWNLKIDLKNNNEQQQQFPQESNNNSGNKKRFKKQQLKKSDSFATNANQNSELENTTASVISLQNQQQNQNYEIQDQQSNQMLLGQKKNLNINKGRVANNKFMKDIELDDESGDKDQPQQNDIFAQFQYKKRGTSNQEVQVAETFNMYNKQNQRPLNPRKKEDREKLKTFNCGRCKAAYQTLGEEFCGNCSKHRSEYTPPHTPEAHYQKFSQSEDDSN